MPESRPSDPANPWLELLANRQFVWLFSGNTALFLSFSATLLLRSLLAWRLTGDAMSLAYIGLVTAACMFVTAIFSGAIIDRLERRRLMLIGQGLILLAETAVLVLVVTGQITFPLLMVSVFVVSTTFPFILPARTIMIVSAVGKGRLRRATAMMSAGFNVAQMVSPALVGFIADWAGISWGYVYLVTMQAAAVWCTFSLRPNLPDPGIRHGRLLAEVGNGFRYIMGNRSLALCMLFGLLPMLIVVPFQSLVVVFVETLWGYGSSGLGLMMAAMGVGGLSGSLMMALVSEKSLVRPMVAATLAMGLLLIGVSNAPWFWLAALFVLGVYSCSMLTQTLVHTSVQLMAEDRFRGRITTMTMMLFGLAPVGTVPLAFAIKHIGPAAGLSLAALVLISTILIMWFFVQPFRAIDEAAQTH